MTMPAFEVLVPDRKAWVAMRDKAKVEKGFSKASIGDDVEKVHKSWGWNSMSAHEKATKKLLTDIGVYISALKKKGGKYATFATTVEKQVQKKAQQQLEFVETVLDQKAAYYGLYKDVLEAQKAARGGGNVKALVTACEKLTGAVGPFSMVDPPMWDKKRQALMKIKSEIERAGQMTDPMSNQLDKVMAALKQG